MNEVTLPSFDVDATFHRVIERPSQDFTEGNLIMMMMFQKKFLTASGIRLSRRVT
jgi:hypothetical protein